MSKRKRLVSILIALPPLLFGLLYGGGYIYRIASTQTYEVVEGICIAIAPKPLRKYRILFLINACRSVPFLQDPTS